jgi:coenzyme F420-reducing hydrogenase delta subunit
MKAFQKGADGVYVAGCLPGDCHFKSGNQNASRRVDYIKNLLDEIGIGSERLEMFTMSAGMGDRFARVAAEFTEKIRALGPNPIRNASGARAALGAS